MKNDGLKITEKKLTPELLSTLISMSESWEAEGSCYGYRKNGKEDIEGNRIFTAEISGMTAGYLFGHISRSEKQSSVMPDGTSLFEVEEIYVVPEMRRRGIGKELFIYAENAVKGEAEFMMLSTAVKNWQAIFRFYLDELGMEFWSARLFKKIADE